VAERQTARSGRREIKLDSSTRGSATEWEIKRDKERGDTDTTDKQTDGHWEQSE